MLDSVPWAQTMTHLPVSIVMFSVSVVLTRGDERWNMEKIRRCCNGFLGGRKKKPNWPDTLTHKPESETEGEKYSQEIQITFHVHATTMYTELSCSCVQTQTHTHIQSM